MSGITSVSIRVYTVNLGSAKNVLMLTWYFQTVIEAEVKKLLALKESKAKLETKPVDKAAAGDANSLNQQIIAQGDKIRQLKSAKVAKEAITSEVNTLLNLKAEYKKISGQDWSPKLAEAPPKPAEAPANTDNKDIEALNQKISAQGNRVRQVKSEKAAKDVVNNEVQQLLELKKEYKALTGNEWKPQDTTTAAKPQSNIVESGNDSAKIAAEVLAQGEVVRGLKAKKADKATVDKELKALLELKKKFKEVTGVEYSPDAAQKLAAQKPQEVAPAEVQVTEESAMAPPSEVSFKYKHCMFYKQFFGGNITFRSQACA